MELTTICPLSNATKQTEMYSLSHEKTHSHRHTHPQCFSKQCCWTNKKKKKEVTFIKNKTAAAETLQYVT